MYLTYSEYQAMGGTLESAAFTVSERRAECFINAQAYGKTGERIARLEAVPQAVKECVFDLVVLDSVHNEFDRQVVSESQSQDGDSESITYANQSDSDIERKKASLVKMCFCGGGIGGLLYRGASI